MKRPRIALCLLMVLFATSLYAVGFAADRDNVTGGYDPANWSAEEADLCEYAHEGYCEYAYDRPLAAYSYDGCTAGDEDSLAIPEDDNCQVAPADIDDLETACIDELESACLENDEIGPVVDDYAAVEAPALGYESGYGDDYSEELAENPEPQASAAGGLCGRYCLTRETELRAVEALPQGVIRNLVERVSDSLVKLLSDRQESMGFDSAWEIDAETNGLAAGDEDSQSVLPLVTAPGWLDGLGWSAANEALAAGMNRAVIVDSLSLSDLCLHLPPSEPQPVSLRALARPVARLVVNLRSGWQQAWSEVSELAAEPDEVPEVSSRPEAPATNPPADSGRDTRTSQRRNPRRVEI